jgi:hypothetical protein
MSPFAFHHKDRLTEPPLQDPVPGHALVLQGDPGYSGLSWWTAFLRLRVTVDGHEPIDVRHECTAVREKTPFTGMVLPVDVEREDPTQVRIRWDEVPTIEQRIASGDPLIFDPEQAWRTVIAADPALADNKPVWGAGTLPGWPGDDALGHGRQAGIALVIGHSRDPAPYMAGGQLNPPSPSGVYRSGGTVENGWHTFLGWLLLCVIPEAGDRYGLHVKTKVKRDRLGPVLPIAIASGKPDEIEIMWDHAPEVQIKRLSAEEELQQAIDVGGHVLTGSETDPELAQIDNPLARRMAAKLAKRGAVVVVSNSEARPAGP